MLFKLDYDLLLHCFGGLPELLILVCVGFIDVGTRCRDERGKLWRSAPPRPYRPSVGVPQATGT